MALNKGTNPYAGSITETGDANSIRTDIGPTAGFPNAFRPSEGQVFTNLGTGLRVRGSQPGMDIRDPQNPGKPGTGNIDTIAREGV